MSNKLDFCPYETDGKGGFRKIEDVNDLAYEIVFTQDDDDKAYEDLKRIMGEDAIKCITIDDERLSEYADCKNKKYYMLLEKQVGQDKCSKDIFLDEIDKSNSQIENPEESFVDVKERCLLKYDELDNREIIIRTRLGTGTREMELCRLVPCCPSCHHRLPSGWFLSEAFLPIGLLAGYGGGKTTLLTSMLSREMSYLNSFSNKIDVIETQTGETAFDNLCLAASRLEGDEEERGICPAITKPGELISPIFLLVQYTSPKGIIHHLMCGVYDNAGEVLKRMIETIRSKTFRKNKLSVELLLNMEANICLIEPKYLNFYKTKSVEPTIEILNIDKQGEYQNRNNDKTVSASECLGECSESDISSGNVMGALSVYNNYKRLMSLCNLTEKFREQQMCFTLVKCDELKEILEREKWSDKLMVHDDPNELASNEDNYMNMQTLYKQLFDHFLFPDSYKRESYEANHKGNVSWHVVSALGCSTDEIKIKGESRSLQNGEWVTEETEELGFRLKGELRPIRVVEPFMACVMKKIQDLKWSVEE